MIHSLVPLYMTRLSTKFTNNLDNTSGREGGLAKPRWHHPTIWFTERTACYCCVQCMSTVYGLATMTCSFA